MLKLYLKNFERKKTCKDFLIKLIIDFFPETYYDENCKNIQCYANRRRSISDLIFLCKTYYKSLTKNKIMFLITSILLDKSVLKNLKMNYFLSYCSTVKKFVICSHVSQNKYFDYCIFYSYYNKINLKEHERSINSYNPRDKLTIEKIIENHKKYLNVTSTT